MLVFEKLDGELLVLIGAKIRDLRKHKKYSQAQLAERIGVSRKHIGDIESGGGTTLLIFVKLMKEFNKSEKLLDLLSVSLISPKEEFLKGNK